MSYISFDSNDIQKGVDAKYVLDCMEDAIYDICEYDYETSKVTLREGFTLEDLVNLIAVGILGDADRWQRLNYEKEQQKKKEEA